MSSPPPPMITQPMSIETPWDPSSRRAVDVERASTLVPITASGGSLDIDAAAASSCAPRHEINEDAHSPLTSNSALFVVADGVGGGAMASTASRELVAHLHIALHGLPVDAASLRGALQAADRRIAALIAAQSTRAGAATVAVCCRTGASSADWLTAWVGDCRIYRVHADASPAELLSTDDTYAELGEPAPPGGSDDDPARMVGNGAVGDPNTRQVSLAPGELLVLCSDGVHKHVDAADMAELLRAPLPLAERCSRLASLARSQGSHDDATVLAVQRTAAGGADTALVDAPPDAADSGAAASVPAVAQAVQAIPPLATSAEKPAPRSGRGRLLALLVGLALVAAAAWMQWRPVDEPDDALAPDTETPAAALPEPQAAASTAARPASAASATSPPAALSAAASRPRTHSTPSMHVEGASAPRRAVAPRHGTPPRRASDAVAPRVPR